MDDLSLEFSAVTRIYCFYGTFGINKPNDSFTFDLSGNLISIHADHWLLITLVDF